MFDGCLPPAIFCSLANHPEHTAQPCSSFASWDEPTSEPPTARPWTASSSRRSRSHSRLLPDRKHGFRGVARFRRSRLGDYAAAASIIRAEQHEGNGELTEASRWARRTVEIAPDDERRLRRVLALLDRVGDRVAALRLYERFEQRRRKE